jgi:hypothetical protein
MGSLMTVSREPARYKLDLVGVQEVRRAPPSHLPTKITQILTQEVKPGRG